MITVREEIAELKGTVGDSSSGIAKDVATLKDTVGTNTKGLVKKVNDIDTDVTALKDLISDDGTTKMLFGMVVTIDGTTGAVSLSEPQAEA